MRLFSVTLRNLFWNHFYFMEDSENGVVTVEKKYRKVRLTVFFSLF